MAKLDRIVLVNSAGFDYLEFPVGGHGQVIGVNGHGKSTLMRTILFF
jgi:ABC-type branched-subunit amino acid transport system ATPase component